VRIGCVSLLAIDASVFGRTPTIVTRESRSHVRQRRLERGLRVTRESRKLIDRLRPAS